MDLLIASDGSTRADALLLSSPLHAHAHGSAHADRTQQPFDNGRATEEAGEGESVATACRVLSTVAGLVLQALSTAVAAVHGVAPWPFPLQRDVQALLPHSSRLASISQARDAPPLAVSFTPSSSLALLLPFILLLYLPHSITFTRAQCLYGLSCDIGSGLQAYVRGLVGALGAAAGRISGKVVGVGG